ncbi:MAG: hypothetical protein R2873_11680 [Caldilineaceae bacterium]
MCWPSVVAFAAFAEAGLLAEGSDPVDGIYSGHEDRISRANCSWKRCAGRPTNRSASRRASGNSTRNSWVGRSTCTSARSCATPAPRRQLHRRALRSHLLARRHRQRLHQLDPRRRHPCGDGWVGLSRRFRPLGPRDGSRVPPQERRSSPEERISAYNKNMTQGGWLSKDLPNLAERMGSRWLVADFEAAMMVHSAYMIHAATVNESDEGRMRLSTDIRYQLVREEIDQRWQNHWSLDDML